MFSLPPSFPFSFHLTYQAAAVEVLGREGSIQDVLAALRSFPTNLEIASHCCAILWNLCTVGEVFWKTCIGVGCG